MLTRSDTVRGVQRKGEALDRADKNVGHIVLVISRNGKGVREEFVKSQCLRKIREQDLKIY